MEMRKCSQCREFNEKDIAEREAKLWQDMVDSLINFTQTSSTLMKGMQNKFGIPPGSDTNKEKCDPCGIFEQIKKELEKMDADESVFNMCTCTETETESQTKEDEETEITAGIECFQPPRVIKRKKFKYSSQIESKLRANKRKAPKCNCNKESIKFEVDACLCKILPPSANILGDCDEDMCPIRVCSDIKLNEIENIHCLGEIPIPKVTFEGAAEDPLAWIPKPGSYDPNKQSQDDSHAYVIKIEDSFQIKNNSLGFQLLKAMRKYGDNIAQIDESIEELEPYFEYTKRCILVARKLKKELSKNDIIGICSDNHHNSYVPYIAGLFNGNRVATFPGSSEKKHLTSCLSNVTPRIMFVSDNCLAFLQECMQAARVNFKIVLFGWNEDTSLGRFEKYLEDDEMGTDDFRAENTDDMDSTCLICFTAGSSEPKAVCISHYTILRQSFRLISIGHAQPIVLSFLEIHGISSLLILFSSILCGATRVIVNEFEEEDVWGLVQKYEINAIHMYPHNLVKLSDLPEPMEDTSALAYIFTAGERLRASALDKLKIVLLKTLISQYYESVELAGYLTLFDFSKLEDGVLNHFVNLSCGKPIDGVYYKVLDMKSRKIVGPLSPGELYIKSKFLRNGYMINNKEEVCPKHEWISTGDYLYYDTNECFHFMNKISDLIHFKKTLIIPSKLETILLNHPMIAEAVVVAIANEEDGQHAAAVVVVKENEDIYSRDLEEWMKTKVPSEEGLKGGIKIVFRIPYRSNGRIYRRALYSMESSLLNGYFDFYR